jgi:hypothetical protein
MLGGSKQATEVVLDVSEAMSSLALGGEKGIKGRGEADDVIALEGFEAGDDLLAGFQRAELRIGIVEGFGQDLDCGFDVFLRTARKGWDKLAIEVVQGHRSISSPEKFCV